MVQKTYIYSSSPPSILAPRSRLFESLYFIIECRKLYVHYDQRICVFTATKLLIDFLLALFLCCYLHIPLRSDFRSFSILSSIFSGVPLEVLNINLKKKKKNPPSLRVLSHTLVKGKVHTLANQPAFTPRSSNIAVL